jgi:ketosteroid isomerase-like protein
MRLLILATLIGWLFQNVTDSDQLGSSGGSAASEAIAKQWFESYKAAWEHRDSQAAAAMFAPDAEYRADPFEPSFLGEKEIRRYWSDVANTQRDVKVTFELLSAEPGVGIVRWRASFVRVPSGQKVELEGIAQFFLNSEGKCTRFLEWWNRKQTS